MLFFYSVYLSVYFIFWLFDKTIPPKKQIHVYELNVKKLSEKTVSLSEDFIVFEELEIFQVVFL